MRSKKSIHESLKAVSFLDDHLRVFPQAGSIEFTIQELSGTAQSPKGILDFVRQVTHQFPIGPMLSHALLFTQDSQPLIDRPQLEQQRSLRKIHRRDNTIEVQSLLARRRQDQVLDGEPPLLAYRLVQQAGERARELDVRMRAGDTLVYQGSWTVRLEFRQ